MTERALQTSGRWQLPEGNLARGKKGRGFGESCKWVLLLGLIAVAFLGCEKPRPLRIGLNPWPGYQFFHLAEERGYFKEEDVQVRLLNFGSLGDTRRAFEREQIDGMCCTMAEVLTTYRYSGRVPKIVLVIDYSDGADLIVAREPIKRVEDLRGHTVAAQPGTVDSVVLTRALQIAGLPVDAVHVHPMATPNMAGAFIRGDVDAAVIYAPLAHEILKQPGADVIFSSKAIPGEIVDVLAAGPDVTSTRRSDFLAVGRALDRAIQFADEHPREASQIMAKYSGVTPESFATSLKGIRMVRRTEQPLFFTTGGALNQSIENTAAALRTTGLITGPVRSSELIVDLAATPAE